MKPTPHPLSRRQVLKLAALAGAAAGLSACASPAASPAPSAPPVSLTPRVTEPPPDTPAPTAAPTAAPTLHPTPSTPADADDTPTPAQTEGPYYTPDTPERASLLEPGMAGTRLVVSGRVLDTAGNPIGRALLDFWHCDAAGVYDNAGYRLRGHQFADAQGAYRLETIVPGVYPGRTRHIHVKVQPPQQPVLTTQLYFPGESANARDGIFNEALLMNVGDAPDGSQAASFNFVFTL
jgi:protocatechuate 3,4-dioxygenase beta subunit